MSSAVADHIVARLSEWGVKRIFGYPGDGITGLMGALDRVSETMELIQVRHEETAALMACAHAKYTGEVGVCLATSGPGAIHLLRQERVIGHAAGEKGSLRIRKGLDDCPREPRDPILFEPRIKRVDHRPQAGLDPFG